VKKKQWLWYVLSACMIGVGILFRDTWMFLDILLILSGIILFLYIWGWHCIKNAQRCPNCNAIIYGSHIRTMVRQKNGILSCEKCGSLVDVHRFRER